MGSGGGGGSQGPTNFSYSYHGDPRATFAQFFGTSNPFESFFNMGGMGQQQGTRGLFPESGEDPMDVDDPFINMGFGRNPGAFRSQSFNMHGPGVGKDKLQDPAIEYDLNVTLEDVLKGELFTINVVSSSANYYMITFCSSRLY